MIAAPTEKTAASSATSTPQAPSAPPAPPAPPVFVADAGQVMQSLRTALARLIEAIPGPEPVRRAADLQRALGLRKTLAWQMFSVAHSPNPLTEAGKIPGEEARTRFFEAASASGAPPAHVAAAVTAFEAFDELVALHSGDRGSFLSMIGGVAGARDPQVDLHYKRAAFRANSYIMGRSVRTMLRCTIVRPNGDDVVDCAMIRGQFDSRVLTPGVRHMLFSARIFRSGGGPPLGAQPVWHPIEANEADSPGLGLLRDYCNPVPQESRALIGDDIPNCNLFVTPGIGRMSSVTCVVAGVLRGQPTPYIDGVPELRSSESIHQPIEVLVHDVMLTRGHFPSRLPAVRIYSDAQDQRLPLAERERCLLRLTETPVFLGSGVNVLHTPDVPRYPEMAQHVLDKLGWNPDEFDVYRCRVEYPVLPSSVVLNFDLRR